MKAIKIASGVAVTALALAISAQANAAAHEGMSTETEWSFTGSMEFLTVVDMAEGHLNAEGDEVTVIDVELDEEDDFDEGAAGDAWGLEADLSIVHGPLSGSLGMQIDDGGAATVEAGDIVITDGAISFGQVGSLVDLTHEYAYDMDDSGVNSEGKDVDAGLRYTMEGLAVQVEGTNRIESGGFATADATSANAATSDFGVAAQYTGEADAVSYVAEAQYRASSIAGDDDSAYTYVGAGVTYTMDMITAKAAFNTYTVTATDANDESILEYGFELTATPVEGLSAYLKGQDLDSGDTNTEFAMKLLVGASYALDALEFTGEYTYTDVEEAGDEVMGRVDYTAGAIAAYGEVTLKDVDGDAQSPLIEAGVSMTQDNGVKYAADYDMQASSDFNAEVNNIRLSAAYAF
jgi:hypothetical protein